MSETQLVGVQGHTSQRAAVGTILAVAGYAVTQVVHVDPDLVLPSRGQIQLDQREVLVAAQHLVAGNGQLPLLGIVGRVDLKGGILGQIGAHHTFGPSTTATYLRSNTMLCQLCCICS